MVSIVGVFVEPRSDLQLLCSILFILFLLFGVRLAEAVVPKLVFCHLLRVGLSNEAFSFVTVETYRNLVSLHFCVELIHVEFS